MIVQSNNTRPSTIQGNNIQPNTTQTSTVSSDTVTVTVTLPASVIASGQEFNITVTPKTQRVTEPRMNTQHAQGVPLTPAHSPRARVPRFELPGLNLGPANSSSVGEDPFVDDDIHASAGGGTRIYPGDRDIQNDTEAVPNVFDVGSSDDGQLSPKPIYPLHPRYGGASRRTSQQVRTGARYYVITKGKKIGVFHDTWYVQDILPWPYS